MNEERLNKEAVEFLLAAMKFSVDTASRHPDRVSTNEKAWVHLYQASENMKAMMRAMNEKGWEKDK